MIYCSYTVDAMIYLTYDYSRFLDLREDKFYLADHPGLVPVTTLQVIVFHFLYAKRR